MPAALNPFTLINHSRSVNILAKSMLPATLVIALIRGSIPPVIHAFAMEEPFGPFALVDGSIAVGHFPSSLGKQQSLVDGACVLPAVGVGDLGGADWKLGEYDDCLLAGDGFLPNDEGSGQRLRILP